MKFQHFLLTRFNVGLYSTRQDAGPVDRSGRRPASNPDDWMEHRLRLFDRYCLPSVKNQSNKNFTWLVMFDERTPTRFKERIDHYSRDCCMVTLYLNIDRPSTSTFREECCKCAKEYISQKVDEDTRYVVTTRLDNDDAVHPDFIKHVQECVPAERQAGPGPLTRLLHRFVPDRTRISPGFFLEKVHRFLPNQGRIAVNFLWGYLLVGDQAIPHQRGSNQFVSLIEPTGLYGGILTVWATEHTRICNVAVVRNLITAPMWIIVIRDRNLANRFREPIPADMVRRDFGLPVCGC